VTYTPYMLTIVETTAFSALWPDYWTAEEFGEFCAWLAVNPMAGERGAEVGRLPQGALGAPRRRQARRCPGDLLHLLR